MISTPGNLTACHPFCAANPVHAWPGVGAHDTIAYHNGREVERHFTAWREGEGYDLEVHDSGGVLASVSWRLVVVPKGSELTIELTPLMLGGAPVGLRRALRAAVVGPMMRRYLRAVLRGVEWRVTTGRPVERNQFGAHPWFSRRQRA